MKRCDDKGCICRDGREEFKWISRGALAKGDTDEEEHFTVIREWGKGSGENSSLTVGNPVRVKSSQIQITHCSKTEENVLYMCNK